jgi:Ca2+-binding RTX toxin-like protein
MSKNAPRLKPTTSGFEPEKVVYNQANNDGVEKHYRICEAPEMRLAANLRGLSVNTVSSRQVFISNSMTQAAGYFSGGEVVWLTGANAGRRMEIKEFSNKQFTLVLPMPNNVTVNGNAGNDTINGGAGSDVMTGDIGNDVYVLNSVSDIVRESYGGGTDIIQSGFNYSLVDTDGAGSYGGYVENLTLIGTASVSGTGNASNNSIVGNSGNNTINGNAGNDTINGGYGNDSIYGGIGNDTLTGGGGYDYFVFNTTLNSSTNRDTILDFNPTYDTIYLENAIMTGLSLATGTLAAGAFNRGPTWCQLHKPTTGLYTTLPLVGFIMTGMALVGQQLYNLPYLEQAPTLQ